MPAYDPITNVMPLASMVTGAPVSAALGDQIRDNLRALYDGWWFRASKSTTTTLTSVSNTTFVFDTIAQSQTSEDDGTITLNTTTGIVTTRKTGLWLVGGHFTISAGTSGPLVCSIAHSDWPVYVAEYVGHSPSSTMDALSCSGVVEQTSASATMSLVAFSQVTRTADSSARSPILWAVWMGERP